MANCPLNKECFAKRTKSGTCVVLTVPAMHYINGTYDCVFRKNHRDKCRGWTPVTEADKKWAEEDKKRVVL